MNVLIIDAPLGIPKDAQKINGTLAYLFSRYRHIGAAVDVILPHGPAWQARISATAVQQADRILVGLKWWHELAGVFELLDMLGALNALHKVYLGGQTAAWFAPAIQARYPAISIYGACADAAADAPLFDPTLTLLPEALQVGLANGFVPIGEWCGEACYFCGALKPTLLWQRTAQSIAADICTLGQNPRLEIFFDSDRERLLIRALDLLEQPLPNPSYFFFWRQPHHGLLERMLRSFGTCAVCLDIACLDPQATTRMVAGGLLKRGTVSVTQAAQLIPTLYREYGVQVDVSFAIGHPFEQDAAVMAGLHSLLEAYSASGCPGQIKFTALHVLPNTRFHLLTDAYAPRWTELDHFLDVSRPIFAGASYYDVVCCPPDGYPLGLADQHTSERIVARWQQAAALVENAMLLA